MEEGFGVGDWPGVAVEEEDVLEGGEEDGEDFVLVGV